MLHRKTKDLTKQRFHEDLILDDGSKVPGQLVQYLTSFQLQGVRFLHQHYVKKANCILNDDKYLGKCFQTAVFLSSITCPTISSFRCLILCKSREKLLNWLYHIELLTDLDAAEFKSTTDIKKNNILIQLVEEIQHKKDLFTTTLWDYVIFDETGESVFTDNDISVLKQIETKVKLIVSTKDIVQNVRHLNRLLLLLNGKDEANDVFKRVIGKFKKSRNLVQFRELLICYCKRFLLRRYGREIKDKLPLIAVEVYQRNFNHWCKNRGFVSREGVDHHQTQINTESSLPNSQNTEEMAPLVLDSDTEDEFDELHDLMQFERKSSDVEILTQKLPSPITISSENPHQRQSSPDLFDSLEEEDSEKTTTYDLTGSLFKFKTKLNTEKASTPITTTPAYKWSSLQQQHSEDLFDGVTTMIEEEEDNTRLGNGKLFEESNRTCIFEITKNDEFPNVIRINSDTEMSPVSNKPLPKISACTLNSKTRNSFEDQKSNKNFHYFFEHDGSEDENLENLKEIIDVETLNMNIECFTPKSTKTPSTSGSSSNQSRWIIKSGSSVKRKLSDSFEKLQSKRLKNHDITKLQSNSSKGSTQKVNPRTVSDQLRMGKKKSLADSDNVADSCSVLFRKSKFSRFLSHSLASSDDEF